MVHDTHDQLRHDLRNLIHDTLAQSLFSAVAISGLLADKLPQSSDSEQELVDNIELALELKQMLVDAVEELKAIQKVLHDE